MYLTFYNILLKFLSNSLSAYLFPPSLTLSLKDQRVQRRREWKVSIEQTLIVFPSIIFFLYSLPPRPQVLISNTFNILQRNKGFSIFLPSLLALGYQEGKKKGMLTQNKNYKVSLAATNLIFFTFDYLDDSVHQVVIFFSPLQLSWTLTNKNPEGFSL